ncbi:cation diffusion facilitator family transporter [Pasteurellaceae bacterium LIM206]|nr:cation diffusion facilitator family transporter [Pasteurellaceae bacterium LIM206]
MSRNKKIIRVSIFSIVLNLILVSVKVFVGLVTNSISVMLDALNNLSDSLSSIITIIGTKIAARAPDKEHPYGYGRIEYLTAIMIAVIIIIAGLTAMKESIEKIINPEPTTYTSVSLLIISIGIAVKFFMGKYVKRAGRSLSSHALQASGTEALYDSLRAMGTLISALLSFYWGLNVDAWLGVVISFGIIQSGYERFKETVDNIIGVRGDEALLQQLKSKIQSYPGVSGVYDLMLHNYGPLETIGSVHIEVPDSMDARQIHHLTREIQLDIVSQFGIVMTVGIYAANDSDPLAAAMKQDLLHILSEYKEVVEFHGFYAASDYHIVTFDLIFDFGVNNQQELKDVIRSRIQAKYPAYRFNIIVDSNFGADGLVNSVIN